MWMQFVKNIISQIRATPTFIIPMTVSLKLFWGSTLLRLVFKVMLWARSLIGRYSLSFDLIGWERHLTSIYLKTYLSLNLEQLQRSSNRSSWPIRDWVQCIRLGAFLENCSWWCNNNESLWWRHQYAVIKVDSKVILESLCDPDWIRIYKRIYN